MDFPFTTDGCSGWMSAAWRRLTGRDPPWEGCCVTHDGCYWHGGTKADRRLADARLLACVAQDGHPVWAILMWASVRLGGHPLLPTPWRWGYGWRWPRGYDRRAPPNGGPPAAPGPTGGHTAAPDAEPPSRAAGLGRRPWRAF